MKIAKHERSLDENTVSSIRVHTGEFRLRIKVLYETYTELGHTFRAEQFNATLLTIGNGSLLNVKFRKCYSTLMGHLTQK